MPQPSRTCFYGVSSKAAYYSLSACYLKTFLTALNLRHNHHCHHIIISVSTHLYGHILSTKIIYLTQYLEDISIHFELFQDH